MTSSSQSLIDLIFVNNSRRIVESGVLHVGISDHSLVYCIMKAGIQKSIPRRIEYRSFKSYNKTAFIDDVSKVPWSVVENAENVDDAVFSWTTLFNDVAQDHAPIKTQRVKGTHVPWMTKELADLMKDRDYHHKKARGLKSGYHWNMFCKLRNEVRSNIKKSKSTYYINLINESKGNSSKLWKAVNEALPDHPSNPITSLNHNGMSVTSSTGIASAFDDFFTNIGSNLSKKFSSSPTILINIYKVRYQTEISHACVRGELGRLKLNKAISLDKISVRLPKDSADIITPSLTYLFNLSIKSSVFPRTWKNAKVRALFKSGNRCDPTCYRPISILPTISKILERAIHQQFFKYMKDNNLLTEKQFGFKPNSSTSIAVGHLADSILKNMDNGQLTGVAFLDLSKAFDTVDHTIWIKKLSYLGVSTTALSWFDSYLENYSYSYSYGYKVTSEIL